MEVDGTATEQGEAFTLADSACLRGTAKTADLSDLTTFDGQVFALARSEQRVVNETNGYSKDPEDQRPTLFVFHRP